MSERVEDLEAAAAGVGPLKVAGTGVAWLTIPSPGSMARFPGTVLHALERRLDEVEGAAEAGGLRALIVRLAPTAGSYEDLHALLSVKSADEAVAEVVAGQASLRRLEQLPFPTVAAIDGPCLGAALELALACSYRFATDAAGTRFALPQLRMGLIPALGGTVRLPRLIGTDAALRLIVHGESLDALRARSLGLVDEAVAAGELDDGVERFALERVERGRLRTGARRRMHRRLIEDTAPGRRMLFARAARVAFGGFAPPLAVRAALSSIADGSSLPLERGFQREAELYAELLVSDTSKSLIHAAMLEGETTHPHPPGGRGVERLAVLGAGVAGMELATLFAQRGFPVRLKDRDRGAVATSVHLVRQRLAELEVNGGALPEGPRSPEQRVEGTTGFGGFGVLDLVIAAPDEHAGAIPRAIADAEEHVSDECLLASASPLVPISDLAAAVRNPSRVIGLITAGPVDLFSVLEIASGRSTSDEAVATACRLARALGRSPVHVADMPGFLVHRLLLVFLGEATRLLHEGVPVEGIDEEMEEFGFTMPPLRRLDALGVGATIRLASALTAALGPRLSATPVMLWLADRGQQLYRYRRGVPVGVNPALPARAAARLAAGPEQIRERLLLALLNEGARALEEGVVASAADVDLALTFGIGYPRRRGGLLYQADRTGLSAAAERLSALASEHGETFAPAPLLTRLAAAGEGFYPARPLATGQASG